MLGWGVAGALTATALTSAAFGLYLLIREARHGLAVPERKQLLAMLSFALPMLPGGLCFFMLHHGDRFFLLRSFDRETVGLYALGYKLAMLVPLFSLNPLYMVWSARMYEAAKRPDAPETFGRVFVRVMAAYLFVGLGLCLFAPEAVTLLGGERYLPAALVIPPVVLACFCQSASSLMDAGLYVKRRTGLKLGVTLATTAVMLTLYVALIPSHGGMGAAMATLGGFAFLALATLIVSRRVFPVRYPWGRLLGVLSLAVVLWLFGAALPVALPWSVAAKAGLWLAAPALAWLTGLVAGDEKAFVKGLLGRLISRTRSTAVPLTAER
jgi:O-antigen/teichoic acid export membrane protein